MGKVIGEEGFVRAAQIVLSEGKGVVFTPKGNSMLPFIRSGRDSVVLSPLMRPLEIGDILLVKIGDRYFLHRVFNLHGNEVTLMGDGNLHEKELCMITDVIGIVTEIRKENGKIIIPGKGKLWRMVRPLRRYLLAFYRRVFL